MPLLATLTCHCRKKYRQTLTCFDNFDNSDTALQEKKCKQTGVRSSFIYYVVHLKSTSVAEITLGDTEFIKNRSRENNRPLTRTLLICQMRKGENTK